MAVDPRSRKLRRVLGRIRERGSTRPLADPLPAAELDALGIPLPDDVRLFFGQLTGGEPGHAGVPPLLDPRVGISLVDDPTAPFPVAEADVHALLPRDKNGPAPAADVPMHGVLAISDHGCAILDLVVLAGPLAGTVWQAWDAGLTPHLGADGGPLRFWDWAEAKLKEILASAPPLVKASTTELDYLWSDARLDAVPPTMRRAKGLRRLILANQPVQQLPEWIGELRELRELVCGSCELHEVPDALGELVALERLSLSKNHLRTLPEALARLPRLRVLDAWGNALCALPPLGELPALESLDIRQNRLEDLAGALPPSLRELKLAGNPLARLPANFTATSVRELRLEDLPALDLDASLAVLGEAPALRVLALSGLRPGAESLSRLTGVTTLRLVAAGYTALPRSLAALQGLEVLSLDQNALDDLPPWLFELPRLRTVVLFANRVSPERLAELRAAHPSVKIEG